MNISVLDSILGILVQTTDIKTKTRLKNILYISNWIGKPLKGLQSCLVPRKFVVSIIVGMTFVSQVKKNKLYKLFEALLQNKRGQYWIDFM